MKNVYILIFGWTVSLFSCRENELDGRVQKVRCQYIAWACDCANWARLEDIKKYGNAGGDMLADRCIFMEPADSSLVLPDSLGSMAIIEFTGEFYKKKGFPKGYSSKEMPDKASVFRYTKYRIIQQSTP